METQLITTLPVTHAQFCRGGKIVHWHSSALPGDLNNDVNELEKRQASRSQSIVVRSVSGQTLLRANIGDALHGISVIDVSAENTAVVVGPVKDEESSHVSLGVVFVTPLQKVIVTTLSSSVAARDLESPVACVAVSSTTADDVVAAVTRVGAAVIEVVSQDGEAALVAVDGAVEFLQLGGTPGEILAGIAGGTVSILRIRREEAVSPTMAKRLSIYQVGVLHVPVDVAAPKAVHAAASIGDRLWTLGADGILRAFRVTESMGNLEFHPLRLQNSRGLSEGRGLSQTATSELTIMADREIDAVDSVCFLAGAEGTSTVSFVVFTAGVLRCGSILVTERGEGECPLAVLSTSDLPFGGVVYGFTKHSGYFHILAQSRRGLSPLYLAKLPGPVGNPAVAEAQCGKLSSSIMWAPSSALSELRVQCEERVAAFAQLGPQQTESLDAVDQAMTELCELQHCAVALRRREAEVVRVDQLDSKSISHALLMLLQAAFTRLSILHFLYRVGLQAECARQICDVLETTEARQRVAAAVYTLREQVNATFGISENGESSIVLLQRWGPSTHSLCVDALLARLGYGADQPTMLQIVHQLTSAPPEVILLVLYFAELAVSRGRVSRRDLIEAKHELLGTFNLSSSLSTWSTALFVADHGVGGDEEEFGSPLLRGLFLPPIRELLPAIVTGLLSAQRCSTLYQMTSSLLTTVPVGCLPGVVGCALTFLTFQRGNSQLLLSLLQHSKGSAWATVAARAVGHAALEQDSVQFLEGALVRGSDEEAIIVDVLKGGRSSREAGILLLELNVLMRRYEEALAVCHQISAENPDAVYQVQVVKSCLRSIVPRGVEDCAARHCADEAAPAADGFASAVPGQLPPHGGFPVARALMATACLREMTGHAGGPLVSCMLLRGTEGSTEAPGSTLKDHATAASLPWSVLETLLEGSSLGIGSALPHAVVAAKDEGETVASTATPCRLSARQIDEMCVVADTLAASMTPFTARRGSRAEERHEVSRTSDHHGTTTEGKTLCEAILTRSQKPCGRHRPCVYHDKPKAPQAAQVI